MVLDWGFWTRTERTSVSNYYRSNCIAYEWHYVYVSDKAWELNIASRNKAVLSGKCEDYYVDEGLLYKMKSLFEEPNRDEMDVWYVNKRD